MNDKGEQELHDQAFILRLPDELLDSIIRCAASSTSMIPFMFYNTRYEYGKRCETPAALCLVSRRINRLATRYLYEELAIYCKPKTKNPVPYDFAPSYSQHEQAPRLMHRSCRENPSLWSLCRRLLIDYADENGVNPYLYVATDFTTWFTAAKSFVLCGLGADEKSWELLRLALKHITGLTLLYLSGSKYNLSLPRIIEIFFDLELEPQGLRALELDGVSVCGDTLSWMKLQGRAGTAPFTALTLRCFLQTPNVLEDLIRWPATLEEFSLEYTFGACYGVQGLDEQWSLAMLQPILAVHKSTLRSIKIRCINKGGLAGFDMREFENLVELSLSCASTTSIDRHNAADIHLVPNLLAPQLHVFHWDLTLEDQQYGESLWDFKENEENWLRALVHAAVTQSCPIRRIELTFSPDPGFSGGFDGEYPWDRIDALGREFQSHGIEVCYNPPCVSREEYMEILKESAGRGGQNISIDYWAISNGAAYNE